jgi:3-phenylpropionate/cinnamic acid dioxygenase small subunit
MHASLTRTDVEAFLYAEARLQDEHRYDEWEALWEDDAVYWVPAGGDDLDPTLHVSYIYDNRRRISSRIRQLKTGTRHAQAPKSRLRRLISNIEIEPNDDGLVHVRANFLLIESRFGTSYTWAGAVRYRLRECAGALRLVEKKVLLVNNADEITTLAFLI